MHTVILLMSEMYMWARGWAPMIDTPMRLQIDGDQLSPCAARTLPPRRSA